MEKRLWIEVVMVLSTPLVWVLGPLQQSKDTDVPWNPPFGDPGRVGWRDVSFQKQWA